MKHGKDTIDRNTENNLIITALLLVILFTGNEVVFLAMYGLIFVGMMLRTFFAAFRKREKLILCLAYGALTAAQLGYAHQVIFVAHDPVPYWTFRVIGVLLMLAPRFIERFITANKNVRFYLPSAEEVFTLSFSDIADKGGQAAKIISDLENTAGKVTPENLYNALHSSKGNNSLTYVNHGTLTEAYFQKAEQHLGDPFVYIVVSDTGSPASEIIGSVTRKVYNHVSLSFDQGLDTIISYNGGENIYPPGLNAEVIDFFHKKEEASILIYRLPVTREQKTNMLQIVRKINAEGSAYNMVGLVTHHSYKPNIMFCSQFVYTLLDMAGLTYFEKAPGEVRPTDFIEQDYHRRLEFVDEIRFNQ